MKMSARVFFSPKLSMQRFHSSTFDTFKNIATSRTSVTSFSSKPIPEDVMTDLMEVTITVRTLDILKFHFSDGLVRLLLRLIYSRTKSL
jgi:hypothetical protein